MKNTYNYIIIALLAALLIFSRVLSPYPNFTAVGAVALFAGFYFGRIRGLMLLLGSLFISDLMFEGVYDIKMMAFVYGSFALSVWLGSSNLQLNFKNRSINNIATVGLKAILSGMTFYLISNLGVWLFSGMYSLTTAGLMECYVLALPFYKFTWLGDLSFAALLFGSYFFVTSFNSKKDVIIDSIKA